MSCSAFAAAFLVSAAILPAVASDKPPPLPDAPSTIAQQAQQTTPESEADRKAREHAEAEQQLHLEEKQRILKVVPNFNTVLDGRAVPLNSREKTNLAIRGAVDPFNFVAAFLLGGVDEVTDSRQGYHWGPKGYFKRAGAHYADIADGTILGGAVFPVLFHQDPRYFRKGTGKFKSRLNHALLSTIICRSDKGTSQFNYSNILGNFTAGAISNTYYPSNETGFALTIENASVVTAEGALGAAALEFLPDISTWFHNRRHRSPTL